MTRDQSRSNVDAHAPLVPLPDGDRYELPEPSSQRGRATRQRLLEAAEEVFGEQGYEGASVAAITTAADAAHGSFYTYFPSKRAIFVELIKEFEHRIRRALAETSRQHPPTSSRAELERWGLDASLGYVLQYPALYRVVREAALFAPDMHRWYFESFVSAYVASFRLTGDDLRPAYVETYGWLMVAIADMFALRWVIWEGRVPPTAVMDGVQEFLAHGFRSLQQPREASA